MPRTFISYRHESEEQSQRVRAFALELESHGIEVILDHHEDERSFNRGGPDEGWHHWSIEQVKRAERVLIIASRSWFDGFSTPDASKPGKGAASEARVIHAELVDTKWVTRKYRVVSLGPDVEVPAEIRDLHRFDGAADIQRIVYWLTGGKAGAAAGVSLPSWPEPDDSFVRPFAGYSEPWAIATEMLSAPDTYQILLVSGESGFGKSSFIGGVARYAETRLGRQNSALVDCRQLELPELLRVLASEVDAASMLPRFVASDQLRASSFAEDLRSLSRPLLLAIDSLDHASEDVRAWLEGALLQAVRKNDWLRVVIAGQEVPPWDDRPHLAGLVRHVRLEGVHDLAAWKDYCSLRKWRPAQGELRALVRGCNGRPNEIVRRLAEAHAGALRAPSPRRSSLTLDAVLQAAAIPHWFDSDLLAKLLGVPKPEAGQWLGRLAEHPDCEHVTARKVWCIHAATRLRLRKSLYATDPDRFLELSKRAARAFSGPESFHIVERLFHRLAFEPQPTADALFEHQESWSRAGRPQQRRLLADYAHELVAGQFVHGRARAYAILGACNLSGVGTPVPHRLAQLQEAIALFIQAADERGELEGRCALGVALAAQGSSSKALAEFHAFKAIALRRVERAPENAYWLRELSVSHNHVGRMLEAQGKRAEALVEFQAGKAIRLRLVERDPENADWLRDLSVSHNHVGRMLEAQGKRAEALVEFQAGKAIMLPLVERDPENAVWLRDLSVSHNQVGRMLEAQGKRAEALLEFQADKAIALRLVERDPENADWLRDLSVSHNHVGRLLEAQGKRAEALVEFQAGKAIMLRLVERDPENADWQLDLSVSHNQVGRMLEAQGKRAEALVEFQAYKAIALRLVELDHDNADWLRELSVSHNCVGRVLESQGKRAEALVEFQAYRAIALRLVERDPDNADWLRELSVAHVCIGQVLQFQGKRAEARSEFHEAVAIHRRLVDLDPDHTGWKAELDRAQSLLRAVGSS